MESITVLPNGGIVEALSCRLRILLCTVLLPSLAFLRSFCLERRIFSHSTSNPAVVGKRLKWMDLRKSTIVTQELAVLEFKKLQWLRATENRLSIGAILPTGCWASEPPFAWGGPNWIVFLQLLPASVVSQFMPLPSYQCLRHDAYVCVFLKKDSSLVTHPDSLHKPNDSILDDIGGLHFPWPWSCHLWFWRSARSRTFHPV